MGAALDIYRLYRWQDNHGERLVLAKATRPEFPNSSQPAEDDAGSDVDARFAAILARECKGLPAGSIEFIASWEGGFPEGDIFYEDGSGIEIEIWMSLDTVHPGHFIFGDQADVTQFWNSLQEMYELGEVSHAAEYSPPAQRVKVLFVQ